ncbi:facilitated trehalose transporter Tret1-like [Neodiprion fabricii]|uniref:facilitated trehalose transporter Tret1-like n=1 Tax=Neodiprion fabricii TaxID=2872261 RepID=UPI001ED94004|nr:facilitated trehalose transporter Tret1-like [Neodiprion fabricii]
MTSKQPGESQSDLLWLQWTGSAGAMIMLFVCGMMGGWTSPYLAKLTSQDSPLPITSDEASWVASLLNFGRLIGAVPGAVSVHYFGSKRTLFLNGFSLIVGCVCTIVADSVIWLYVARLISGLCLGMSYSSFPLYLGEISSPATRGALVTLASTGLSVGVLAGNVVGAYVSMTVFAYITLVPTTVFMLLFLWMPESPHYFIRLDKIEEARKSIARYHPGVNVEVELKSLQDFIHAIQSRTFADKLREFNVPANRKAGIIVVLLYVFMQLSGVNSVLFYLEIILTKGRLTIISPAKMVIIGGATAIFGGLTTVYLAAKCGRKTLLIASCVGVAVSLVILGTDFALLGSGFDSAQLQWTLVSSVIIYHVFVYMGLCPVPNIVLSELFAPNIKNMAACFASISVGLFAFISTKVYQPLVNIMGEAYVFWMHAAFMVMVIIFTLTAMPETKGKSLQEIQAILHKK